MMKNQTTYQAPVVEFLSVSERDVIVTSRIELPKIEFLSEE